ncbi:hypothetical protein ACLM5H_00075 [Fredinandcohnia humi]
MATKLKLILSICLLFVVFYFGSIALKDDDSEIVKAFQSLNEPFKEIAHIEMLDNTKSIVFYESTFGDIEVFGNVRLKKNIFGWRMLSSGSSQTPQKYKLGWHFSNLAFDFHTYTDLIFGKIYDSNIEEVVIVTKNHKKYHAEIIEYGSGKRF